MLTSPLVRHAARNEKHEGIFMTTTERPVRGATANQPWGSDPIAELLRALNIEFIALTPGASFRGLHDSLVNHLHNTRPELLLCLHEEHAVALAHGYARVTNKPLAVALHSNVGLMHATMAIFNAWCDRVPILMLGAVGPVDAMQRRPWVDWIHTASDLGALIRGYTKWDDQPGSVAAALESIVRAHQIATTLPKGPTYVCLDAALQEERLDKVPPPPPLKRFGTADPPEPSAAALATAATALTTAKRPLILIGRVSNSEEDWDRRVALVERIGARVLTDLKNGACFPTQHPAHPFAPGLFVGADAGGALIREADVILALDWIDIGGTLRQACGGEWPTATVINCSLNQSVHNGWSMDYQALPAVDLPMLASPDSLVTHLLRTIGTRATPVQWPTIPPTPATQEAPGERISIDDLARITTEALAGHAPSFIRLPLGWPGTFCRFAHPLDYIGFDGGGGIGSGPGMAVGAAIALRGTGRLPVAILGDGDYLMGLTAIWTAVHYRVPVLIIVGNNASFFNDELHQERVARLRSRPVENRSIGLRMDDPPLDLAKLAEGQGAIGFGPVERPDALAAVLADAIAKVRGGATVVVDVHIVPEYARGISSALLRQIPAETEGKSSQ
jgi:thiamine pyrophosphate-dependent acetolactate synthase large subunit-like protein